MNNPQNNNNGQFPNNPNDSSNSYPNNYPNNNPNNSYPNNYPYNNNYNANPQGPNPTWGSSSNSDVINKTKKIAIAYIALFPFTLLFLILAIAGLSAAVVSYAYSSAYGNVSPGGLAGAGTALLIIFLLLGIVIEVLAIVLIVKTSQLKNYLAGTDSLWILFLIGIFIPIVSFIAGIMTIVVCKKYLI